MGELTLSSWISDTRGVLEIRHKGPLNANSGVEWTAFSNAEILCSTSRQNHTSTQMNVDVGEGLPDGLLLNELQEKRHYHLPTLQQ